MSSPQFTLKILRGPRTGANTALFDDFLQDDRCLLASCFHQKVENHIAREKQNNQGLIQITRAYYTQTKGEEPTLTRGEYTVVEPQESDQAGKEETARCATATSAIVVEGPGKRGEIIQVCADSNCAVHGKPNHRAEQEAVTRQREQEWQARQQERTANRDKNRQLLDSVHGQIPKVLKRADFETLLFAVIERLDTDDWEAIAERCNIDTDNFQEPDAAAVEFRKKAESATDSQLVRMLFELALLPFGYSEGPLEFTNPLASAARRYEALLTAKKTTTTVKEAQLAKAALSTSMSRLASLTIERPLTCRKCIVAKGLPLDGGGYRCVAVVALYPPCFQFNLLLVPCRLCAKHSRKRRCK